MELNNIKALLVDLDGTLINSEKAFFESFRDILKNNYLVSITKDDYKKYELEQNAKLLITLKEKNILKSTISDQDIMKLIYDYYFYKFIEVIKEPEAVENFELLKKIKDKGYTLGLITTCRKRFIDVMFEELKLNGLFDIVIAREDVLNLKPCPDAYIYAINKLGLNLEECLAIEDSKRGIDASISAGIKTIKVDNFCTIKESDPRTIEEKSANIVFRKILSIK